MLVDRRNLLGLSAAALSAGLFSGKTVMAAEPIRIEFTLFSAFYSPLVATIAGGFLQAEGLAPVYTVSAPGRSALASLDSGNAHVVQTAPSQAFNALEKGDVLPLFISHRSTKEMASFSPLAMLIRISRGTS
jgi:NitT/TauT family transport system substrate-binding protein